MLFCLFALAHIQIPILITNPQFIPIQFNSIQHSSTTNVCYAMYIYPGPLMPYQPNYDMLPGI